MHVIRVITSLSKYSLKGQSKFFRINNVDFFQGLGKVLSTGKSTTNHSVETVTQMGFVTAG